MSRFDSGVPDDGRGAVVTVGTFDGVHRGHRAVLDEIHRRAEATDRRAILVTFHPHPLRIVRPEFAPPLLTTPVEKKEILAESGLDWAVFLTFTPELSRLTPRQFVESILVRRLGVSELVIGYDHGFGRGRSGDADTLRQIGAELGFEVDVVAPIPMEEGPEHGKGRKEGHEEGKGAVSSTRIRDAVAAGQLRKAAEGLGRPYSARGFVVRGEGRGRDLGFPTANLHIGSPDKLLPPAGIYAVRAALPDGMHDGALHLGPRPTFEGSPPSIELHVLDFEGDLYGSEVRVDFVERLRGVEPFSSAADLVRQMEEDVKATRSILGR